MQIRTAQPSDGKQLLAIYQPYVEQTTVSFEYQTPTLAEFSSRIKQTLTDFPYLVVLEDNQILGYAYAHAYGERSAYQWSAEISVYIAEKAHGKGIGRSLYAEIEQILAKQNIVNITACITGENEASLAFHQKLGYEKVAQFKKIGFKNGQWLDTFWLQKELNRPEKPLPFIPFSKLSPKKKRYCTI
ncbi:N-acetyltransferase [Fructobacillus sp. M1-10]|uniref:N-acetyltransferase n=1 Tax=Fructobacillus papyriferae TaxID=2713171 RepID=A0ABS5QNP8_9LACO|nr:N-acetyltransferase [Fructobacillus papyriferae]